MDIEAVRPGLRWVCPGVQGTGMVKHCRTLLCQSKEAKGESWGSVTCLGSWLMLWSQVAPAHIYCVCVRMCVCAQWWQRQSNFTLRHTIHAPACVLCWRGPWLSGSHQTVLVVQGYAFPEAGSSAYGAELEVRSPQGACRLAWSTQGSCSAQKNLFPGSETSRQRPAGARSPLSYPSAL